MQPTPRSRRRTRTPKSPRAESRQRRRRRLNVRHATRLAQPRAARAPPSLQSAGLAWRTRRAATRIGRSKTPPRTGTVRCQAFSRRARSNTALMVDGPLIALLTLVAMIAGFVDSIAGGGGILIMPALLWAGVPPIYALGTNKLQSVFGTAIAL